MEACPVYIEQMPKIVDARRWLADPAALRGVDPALDLERQLARSLADAAGTTERPALVVADLSFISLRTVLPALLDTVGTGADFVLLIKPQFEVGRTGIREGIVRDPALREEAVNEVLWAAWDLGLPTAGLIASPLAGLSGNREFLVWFSATHGTNPTQWRDRVHSDAGSDKR